MCVESLVAHGAHVFIENVERLTPSYLAKSHGHKEVALFLDSKLIVNVIHFFKDVKLTHVILNILSVVFSFRMIVKTKTPMWTVNYLLLKKHKNLALDYKTCKRRRTSFF